MTDNFIPSIALTTLAENEIPQDEMSQYYTVYFIDSDITVNKYIPSVKCSEESAYAELGAGSLQLCPNYTEWQNVSFKAAPPGLSNTL